MSKRRSRRSEPEVIDPIQKKKNAIAELNEQALFADGLEGGLIGYVQQKGGEVLALYDYEKCVEILVRRDEMTYEEAVEWMEFNVVDAYVGPSTPAFCHLFKKGDPV